MDIILDVPRKVVVNYSFDVLHIQTSSRHIRRDHDWAMPSLKSIQQGQKDI
jgi:hypothetical protein